MGLPIISEIWDGIRWLVDFFFNKVPKPVTYMLFIGLLFVFSTFIAFSIHLFGIHCNSDGDIVKVSALKLGSNIELAFIGANEPLNESAYQPQPITWGTGVIGLASQAACYRSICLHNGQYYYRIEDECENETILYPFKTRSANYWRCSVCNGTVNSTFIRGTFGASETEDLCFGNSAPLDPDTKNFYQEHYCDPSSQCAVPDHYYYDYLQNLFICADNDICGENITNDTMKTKADFIINNAGGKLLYPASMKKQEMRSAVMYSCDEDNNPQLTFFKIAIFDFRYWLILSLIFIMFMFLTHLGQQGNIRR